MEKTKITKREMFEAIKETFETGECKFDASLVIEFCEKEIGSLDTKAVKAKERAATKRAETDTLMEAVREALTGDYQTIADIAAAVAVADPEATASKITYRLTKLIESGVAEKTEVSIPGVDGAKMRKVKAFRKVEA